VNFEIKNKDKSVKTAPTDAKMIPKILYASDPNRAMPTHSIDTASAAIKQMNVSFALEALE
jgi:hypothetical protein